MSTAYMESAPGVTSVRDPSAHTARKADVQFRTSETSVGRQFTQVFVVWLRSEVVI